MNKQKTEKEEEEAQESKGFLGLFSDKLSKKQDKDAKRRDDDLKNL